MPAAGRSGKLNAENAQLANYSRNEVSGTDLSNFFSRYIASRDPLPAKQCFADTGFDAALADYAGEAFITSETNPSASARAVRARLLRQ
jgi:hypothetical protein